MRRIFGLVILIGTGLLYALVVAVTLADDRRAVTSPIADWTTTSAASLSGPTYLSLPGAQLAPTGPWHIRRVGNAYLIPLFAATDGTTGDTRPRAILRLPVGRLAERIAAPTQVEDGIRLHAAGTVSSDCAALAAHTLAMGNTATRLAPPTCIDDAAKPADPVAVMTGLTIMAAPLVFLGLWLRRGSRAGADHTGWIGRIGGKFVKGLVILAFIVLVPLARFADDGIPAVVKTFKGDVPKVAEIAADTAPALPRFATDQGLIDLSRHERLALEAVGKAKDAADWAQRLDQLGLLPNDERTRELHQLDTTQVFEFDPGGFFRLRSANALLEERIMHNGHPIASRVFVGRGYLAWDGVKLTANDDGGLDYLAYLAGMHRTEHGVLRFEAGDQRAWRAGDAVRLRSRDEADPVLVTVQGKRMVVRRGQVVPARLPTP